MSRRGEVLHQPVNGTPEQTWEGFSWPAFLFGVIWLLSKGLYGHFIISLVILLLTLGFAAPIIWIVYGFGGNAAHRESLLKKGYLTSAQWQTRSAHFADASPQSGSSQRDHIAQLRELADLRDKGVVTEEEFREQKASLLGARHTCEAARDDVEARSGLEAEGSTDWNGRIKPVVQPDLIPLWAKSLLVIAGTLVLVWLANR